MLIQGRRISDITALPVRQAQAFFAGLTLNDFERQVADKILQEICARLRFLSSVGLDYLTLDRTAATLSGGEGQRIRLATQIGSGLVGVLYVLDEPSIGLHQRDNQRLLESLKRLRDLGNTVLVVEHDRETILAADYVLDLGPGAGEHGGHLVAAGPQPALPSIRSHSLANISVVPWLSPSPVGGVFRVGVACASWVPAPTIYNTWTSRSLSACWSASLVCQALGKARLSWRFCIRH